MLHQLTGEVVKRTIPVEEALREKQNNACNCRPSWICFWCCGVTPNTHSCAGRPKTRMMGTMKHHEIPPTVHPYGRLKLVGAGLAFAAVGIALLLSGVQVVIHWTGQPMFSWGLIAAGGLCVVLALIPASWIAKAATIDSRTPRHR
jgi:uncharacterized protein YcsI (UPF0317 family)